MTAQPPSAPSICFVGLANLPVLAREFAHHGVGGAELQQTLLARALARRGTRVSMVVGDYGQPDGAQWCGIKTYKAYRPDEGIPLLRFVHPRWTKLWAAMKRAAADIYYTSCAGAQVGQVAMFARLHGAKAVFRIASDSDCDPAAVLIRFRRDKFLYRYGLQRADLVLAQTPQQHAALLRHFRRDSRVVPSLTDSARSRRAFHERDIDVLWVGNLRALKRPERLLEAARKLPQLRFHMIGGPMPGAHELFESVRSAATQLPNVQFHGAVSYHAIGDLYARARVFVGTSETEGFPNSYLQAWAHGVPVVAFLDPEQLLARKSLGHAVGSMDEMASSIAVLNGDRVLWEAASLRCTQYMDSRFNESQMVRPYVEALSDLFAPPPATSAGAH